MSRLIKSFSVSRNRSLNLRSTSVRFIAAAWQERLRWRPGGVCPNCWHSSKKERWLAEVRLEKDSFLNNFLSVISCLYYSFW